LQNVIAKVMGESVLLINSAGEVVKTINEILHKLSLENLQTEDIIRQRSFYTSDSEEKFKELGSVFLDMEIESAKKIDIESYKA
jgi:glutamate racemase